MAINIITGLKKAASGDKILGELTDGESVLP
jgi:hypothetical protein